MNHRGTQASEWAAMIDPSRSIVLQWSIDTANLDGFGSLLTISTASTTPAAGFHLRGVIRTGSATSTTPVRTR